MGMHQGRTALVTGAGKGIGREIALRLAREGADIMLFDREKAEETADEIGRAGGEAVNFVGDVANESDWQSACRLAEDTFGTIDILINNAGIYPFAVIDDLTPEIFRKVLQVNLEGPYLGARTISPLMKKKSWGRIVNLSSNSISTNLAGLSHYMASKMGVIGLTRGLANDLGEFGITVNAVAPAITNTPGTSVMPDELLTSVWQRQAIRRFAEPADIAGTVLFLTTDDAAFVTGQTISVDGGMMKM